MRPNLLIIASVILGGGCDNPKSPPSNDGTSSSRPSNALRKEKREVSASGIASSPRATLESALALESGSGREKALSELAWNTIETDPALAHEAFKRLSADSPERLRLVQFYALRLAEENPDEALKWAKSLGSEFEISAAIGQIALAVAEANPQYSANLLSDSGVAGRELDIAVVEVIQRWASKSAPDAAAWVSRFQAGDAREAGVRAVVKKWLPGDPSAVFSWMDSLDDAKLRSEVAAAIGEVIPQQTKEVRETWLHHATPSAQRDLQQHETEPRR